MEKEQISLMITCNTLSQMIRWRIIYWIIKCSTVFWTITGNTIPWMITRSTMYWIHTESIFMNMFSSWCCPNLGMRKKRLLRITHRASYSNMEPDLLIITQGPISWIVI